MALVEHDRVLAPVVDEAAELVVEFPARPRRGQLGALLRLGSGPTLSAPGGRRVLDAADLLGQGAQAARQHHACGRRETVALGR